MPWWGRRDPRRTAGHACGSHADQRNEAADLIGQKADPMRNALVLLTLAAVGCGGSSSSDNANAGDVRTLNTLSQDVSAAAATYGTEAGGMADLTACNTDESGYDAQ